MNMLLVMLIFIQGGILGYFLGQLVILRQFKDRLEKIKDVPKKDRKLGR